MTDDKLSELLKLAKAALAADADPVSLVCGANYVDTWERYNDACDPDTVIALVERVREAEERLNRAGLAAFMRGRPPEEVADHLQMVVQSYEDRAEKAEAERDELRAEKEQEDG